MSFHQDSGKLRKLLNSLPFFVSYISNDLRYEFTNDANRSFFPHLKEIVGMSMQDVFGPERFERVRPNVERALRGEQVNWELSMPSDRGMRYVEGSYVPDFDSQGTVAGFFVYVNDITHRKKIEQDLHQSEENYKLALNARDEFLSMASHELKTPITSLILNTDLKRLMLKRAEVIRPENELESLEIQHRQLQRINQVIDDMLDLSRIRIGKLEMKKSPVDFAKIVEEALTKLGSLLIQTLGSVNFETVETAIVHGDPFRLEQVITNLLSNAAKYGEHKPITVTVKKSETQVIFCVEDQGRGISAEDQQRIFARFERAVSGTDIAGLGLGLTIVKEILDAHQGHITVESQPGAGAKFQVELPLHLT